VVRLLFLREVGLPEGEVEHPDALTLEVGARNEAEVPQAAMSILTPESENPAALEETTGFNRGETARWGGPVSTLGPKPRPQQLHQREAPAITLVTLSLLGEDEIVCVSHSRIPQGRAGRAGAKRSRARCHRPHCP
jgi:hypothetical protein